MIHAQSVTTAAVPLFGLTNKSKNVPLFGLTNKSKKVKLDLMLSSKGCLA